MQTDQVDPAFGDNRLPGIPKHVIHAELSYHHPSGFYLTPSVDVSAGKAFVDFANTLGNGPHAIVNLRTGFDHPAGWSVFLKAENLTNKLYASSTGYRQCLVRFRQSRRVQPRVSVLGIRWFRGALLTTMAMR